MALSDDDEARLRIMVQGVVSEELDSRRTIPIEEHRDHHDYIRHLIEERQVSRERWEAVRRQVIGWSVIAVLVAIGTLAYESLIGWLRKLLGNGG